MTCYHFTIVRLRPAFSLRESPQRTNIELQSRKRLIIFALIALALASSINPTSDASTQTVLERSVSAPVETIVRAYFSDIPILIEVAHCESRFRHTLANGFVVRGEINRGDIGVMQINEFYHRENALEKYNLDIDDLFDNLAYARKLYEEEGTTPWNSSRKCWGAAGHVAQSS